MAVAGLISLLPPGSVVQDVFGWVWPPVLFGLVVWMFIRSRRQLRSRGARWLLYPVLAMLMVASVGGGYQTVRQSIDTRAYPMPGQLVDVGGHRMHIYCTGSGSPTVILEPSQGGASSDSGWVAPTLARDSTQAGPPVTYAVVPRPPTAAVEEALLPPPARQPRVRRRLVLTVLAWPCSSLRCLSSDWTA
jgi:hypothetical protein